MILKLRSLLHRLYAWHVLKIIGGSYISGLTIFVPLFGYIIFFGSFKGGVYSIDLSSIFNLREVNLSVDLVNLKMTYVGLSLIGFSTIVFRMFCPSEISGNRGEREFIEAAISTAYTSNCARLLQHLAQERWYDFSIPEREDLHDIKIIASRSTNFSERATMNEAQLRREDWLEKNIDGLNALYLIKYRIEDYSGFLVRTTIMLGYSFGFIFTLVPSLKIFFPALLDVSSRLLSLIVY